MEHAPPQVGMPTPGTEGANIAPQPQPGLPSPSTHGANLTPYPPLDLLSPSSEGANSTPGPQMGRPTPGVEGAPRALAKSWNVEIKQNSNLPDAVMVVDGRTMNQAFSAVNEADGSRRWLQACLPDCAPWAFSIFFTEGGSEQLEYKLHSDSTCACCCFNRRVVTVTDATTNTQIGSFRDPCAMCGFTFSIRDPQKEDVLAVRGGMFRWGLCHPLYPEISFSIDDAKSGKKVGEMDKKFASDVDKHMVEFGSVENPAHKAMLLAVAVFAHFRYFNNGGICG